MNRKIWLTFCSIIFFIFSFLSFFCYNYLKNFYELEVLNNISIEKIKNDNFVLNISNIDSNTICGFSNFNSNTIHWNKTSDCHLKVNYKLEKVFIKKWFFKRGFLINDLVIGDDLPKKIYLALNDEKELTPKLKLIGNNKNIVYESLNKKIVIVKDNKIIGKKVGKAKVKMTVNNNYSKEIIVEVTDLITKRPKSFNNNKPNLPCNRYSKNESLKLDNILKNKIELVGGYGTRAAVVESIRFLMLDFPYQIEYFFENGRIDGGMHNADGEGRYYHKGLYLNENKYKDLKYSFSGPSIWGCPLRNYEDWGNLFKKGQYKPNGLDCSGFVTWSIVNGGFDPGDKGAGDNLEDTNEINDIGGVKADTSVKLFKSGKVKAGDLLGVWGHIAIVAGIDDKNVYVAESLWTFGGPVINTYTFEEATNEFVQTVLLDDYYKDDGLYTDMWY